jgi:hypothetical protein
MVRDTSDNTYLLRRKALKAIVRHPAAKVLAQQGLIDENEKCLALPTDLIVYTDLVGPLRYHHSIDGGEFCSSRVGWKMRAIPYSAS